MRDGDSVHRDNLIDGLLADLDRLAVPAGKGPLAAPAEPPHPDGALLALAAEMDAAAARERAARAAIEGDDSPEAEDAGDAAGDEVGRIVDRMVPLRAGTLDGLRAKARAYLWCTAGHLPDPSLEPATSGRVEASLRLDFLAGRAAA